MFIYNYSRELTEQGYNINNNNIIDIDGNGIFLPKKIKILLGKDCKLKCYETNCEFSFEEELTTIEKNNLNILINNYKLGII